MKFRSPIKADRDYILKANEEINVLSGLDDSSFAKNIDNDLYKDHSCKAIIAEEDNHIIGFILYSYIYFANCGKGIYLSQAYVSEEYRGKGVYRSLLNELERTEPSCKFITDFVGKDNDVMQQTINKLGFKMSNLDIYYRFFN